jgi:hypothetical protein
MRETFAPALAGIYPRRAKTLDHWIADNSFTGLR